MLLVMRLFSLAAAVAAQDFCKVTGKYISTLQTAINKENKEASGLVLNADRKFFFTVSDSPEGKPYIYVTRNTQSPSSASTIKITGVNNTGFNSGYGDWEAVVSYRCSADSSRRCIVVGDIGHNKVRNKGGVLRSSTQSVRFIEVEEPTATELGSGQLLEKQGKEFGFKYPKGARYDAEAMVVKGDKLFVITKNSKSYQYSHMFEVPALRQSVELIERAIFQVKYSEVTGAAASPGYLILRTYSGLNFYKWDALCDDSVRRSKVYQSIPYLASGHGLQEGVEYDASTGYVYLTGEGRDSLYRMTCTPAASPSLSPVFGAQCLDDYNGAAKMIASGAQRGAAVAAWALIALLLS